MIIWNPVFITYAISILIVNGCYRLRSRILQKLLRTVHTSNCCNSLFNKVIYQSMMNIIHLMASLSGILMQNKYVLSGLNKARKLFVVICSYPETLIKGTLTNILCKILAIARFTL